MIIVDVRRRENERKKKEEVETMMKLISHVYVTPNKPQCYLNHLCYSMFIYWQQINLSIYSSKRERKFKDL